MSSNQFISQTGIKIKYPDRFCEEYDKSMNIRKYGVDNLYPQHIRDFIETSPTFSTCVNRMTQFLYGITKPTKLFSRNLINMLLSDYSIFGGFALFVVYDGLGDINNVTYIPFESIRLGEMGYNGIYTYCYYSPDWACRKTVNKKRITKTDRCRYWMFTDNIETRLARMQQEDYAGGEVLYYSNRISYPCELCRPVINYLSTEVGCQNILYREMRTSFLPSTCLAIPRQSDGDENEFQNNLARLQGDENAFKIMTVTFSSQEDKPEALNIQGDTYLDRVITASNECNRKITDVYGQSAFIRLSDGGLGFSQDVISDIYNFYNKYLDNDRVIIESELHKIDPTFKFEQINYNL